ncbi:hypothetical protein PAPYR_3623 [Paratrimastix pyriformis]|uniref:Clathrin light chain n=1 Tax=Paratrimastix pyriformis TaxID=342808 RepID=A0ABQ8UPM2_9EUKA|nr:hypothetical protein PAPYR_3623 [Paratrimastix pyriformis]
MDSEAPVEQSPIEQAPVEPAPAPVEEAPLEPAAPQLSPLQQFEIEHAQFLQEKQRKSSEAQEKVIAEAAQDLAKFYETRTESIRKRATQNREEEALTKQHLESTEGTVWERACDLANFQQTFKKDTTRLRQTMLRLKNKPAVSRS